VVDNTHIAKDIKEPGN